MAKIHITGSPVVQVSEDEARRIEADWRAKLPQVELGGALGSVSGKKIYRVEFSGDGRNDAYERRVSEDRAWYEKRREWLRLSPEYRAEDAMVRIRALLEYPDPGHGKGELETLLARGMEARIKVLFEKNPERAFPDFEVLAGAVAQEEAYGRTYPYFRPEGGFANVIRNIARVDAEAMLSDRAYAAKLPGAEETEARDFSESKSPQEVTREADGLPF